MEAIEIDKFVGAQIRTRRLQMGETQGDIAAQVGVKFQQVQKYETGANRVSASRLYLFAQAQGVPVSFYFEGLPETAAGLPFAMAEAARILLNPLPPEVWGRVFEAVSGGDTGGAQ